MKSNKEHYITKVNFYDSINDSMLKFAVNGKSYISRPTYPDLR